MLEHDIIVSFILMLTISCFTGLIIKKLVVIPYTISLVIMGLVISFLHFDIAENIHITKEIVFLIFLPPLLFQGAYHLQLDELKQNFVPILLNSIPGVIISTFIIGFLIHIILGLDLIYAFLFGALISPTDPISVISIFREVGAPKRLRVLMEGESLFNDGAGVVLFTVILGLIVENTEFNFLNSFVNFLYVCAGGFVVGYLAGKIANSIMRPINDHLWELMLTVILVYGTYLLAETINVSGVIAVVIAGLLVGNHGKAKSMSDQTINTIDTFWEGTDFIINSILFFMIGLEMQFYSADLFTKYLFPIFISILILLTTRSLTVFSFTTIYNLFSKSNSNTIPFKWTAILSWGGLRGSIPIALVLGLAKDMPNRELILVLTFGIVFFSLLVQGLSMRFLLKLFKI